MQQLLRPCRPDCCADTEADMSQFRTQSARIAVSTAKIGKRHFD
jgi:hypothetical protein